MPHILKKLLGGGAPYRMSSGQLALRFPGDACVGDGCECPPDHFEGVRKGCAPQRQRERDRQRDRQRDRDRDRDVLVPFKASFKSCRDRH